jgi:small subunit ribosomal protein S4e
MAKRGVYKHLKRIHAPKSWMLSKVGGIWATKPSQGPHKLRECIPLNYLLRHKLRLALNGTEAKLIVKSKEGNISINCRVRTDPKFPVGIMDIVTINKTGTNYRVNFDVKGRWRLVKISKEDAKYKLCKVTRRSMGPKRIPFITTADGRTIRYPNPHIKEHDSVKINIETGEIISYYKYKIGAPVLIVGGNNIGRVGVIEKIEKHPGSYEIVYIKDKEDKVFSTRLTNIFITGDQKPEITEEIYNTRYDILQERERRGGRKEVKEGDSE